MTTNMRNVDICVTCVSDKPPQLPLREELPSLGIEVVYNAQGVGAKATEDESKQQMRKYRERKNSFHPSPDQYRKRQERVVGAPKALSYSTYQKQLEKNQDRGERAYVEQSSSSRKDERKMKNRSLLGSQPLSPTIQARFQDHRNDVEVRALSEAFKVFSISPVADQHLPYDSWDVKKALSSSAQRPDSYASRNSRSDPARDPPSSPISHEHLPRLSSMTGKQTSDSVISIDAPGLSTTASSQRGDSFRQRDPSPSKTRSRHPTSHIFAASESSIPDSQAVRHIEKSKRRDEKNGSIKMKMLESNSHVTGVFDLTDPSEGNSEGKYDDTSFGDDLSTIPSRKEPPSRNEVQRFSSRSVEKALPGLQLQIPTHKDDSGRMVLDLSYIGEDEEARSSDAFSLRVSDCDFGEEVINRPSISMLKEERCDVYSGDNSSRAGSAYQRPALQDDGEANKDVGDLGGDTFLVHQSHIGNPSQTNVRLWPFAHGAIPLAQSLFNVFRPERDKITSIDKQNDGGPISDGSSRKRAMEPKLNKALFQNFSSLREIEENLLTNPDVAHQKCPKSKRFLLHEVCSRRLPEKIIEDPSCRVEDLVEDVVGLRVILASLQTANPGACTSLDCYGDLPVHLLARQLMEWEARWYQKVYENAQEETQKGNGITALYQTMAQCIDLLLIPLTNHKALCNRGGCIGNLMPLHIAAIFTVSYDTLRSLLEQYPDAAAIQCDLNGIRTFVPTNSVPLELHDKLSTDMPKWEIDGAFSETDAELTWTQSMLDKSYGTTGGMRRSDLIFAFHPKVTPYYCDSSRIRRIEERICEEATTSTSLVGEQRFDLSSPVKRLWIWLCTFTAEADNNDFSDSVKRIVGNLSFRAILHLATLQTNNGKVVLDDAPTKYSNILLNRMSEIAEKETPIPLDSFDLMIPNRSALLDNWRKEIASRFSYEGRGFVATLLRSLFNIREEDFPTSFVLLPYKLVKEKNGKLGLESAEAATLAMKFADCLLHLTSPKSVSLFLQKKAKRFRGKIPGFEKRIESEKTEQQIKEAIRRLLAIYEEGPAYFYFIDELTGIPIVSGTQGVYPLVVNDSFDMVRKILPLMLTGMILMRGEKAHGVIATLLTQQNECVQSNWIETAKDMAGYLYSPKTEWTRTFVEELLPIKDRVVDFLHDHDASGGVQTDSENGRFVSNEWVVEISLVKMIVEMHDPGKSYSGLRPKHGGQKVLWTNNEKFLDSKIENQLYFDFLTTQDMKKMSGQYKAKSDGEKSADGGASLGLVGSSESNSNAGLDLLFGELSFAAEVKKLERPPNQENERDNVTCQWPRDISKQPNIVSHLQKPKAASLSTSIFNFDDDLELDEVLQLRILLDEQEAKLEFLRDKINDIQEAELDLLRQEERVSEMINETNNKKSNLVDSPSNQGLSKARSLLIRICELENRVLCKEVEVGQLKNGITCLELQAREAIFSFDSELDSDNEEEGSCDVFQHSAIRERSDRL